MDFREYYETGAEEIKSEIQEVPADDNDGQVIDEGLVDVVFKNIKSALKTSVSGPLIYFRWEWLSSKTYFTLRIRRKTLVEFTHWLNSIVAEFDDDFKDDKKKD